MDAMVVGRGGKDLVEQVLTLFVFIIFVMPSLYIAAHDNKRIPLTLNQPPPLYWLILVLEF